MTNPDIIEPERDRQGRFLTGGKAGPGRPKGSRNKLAENFVADLRDCWEKHGAAALERVAAEHPEVLVKVIASILPRDLNLNVDVAVNAADFVARFRTAQEILGNEPPRRVI